MTSFLSGQLNKARAFLTSSLVQDAQLAGSPVQDTHLVDPNERWSKLRSRHCCEIHGKRDSEQAYVEGVFKNFVASLSYSSVDGVLQRTAAQDAFTCLQEVQKINQATMEGMVIQDPEALADIIKSHDLDLDDVKRLFHLRVFHNDLYQTYLKTPTSELVQDVLIVQEETSKVAFSGVLEIAVMPTVTALAKCNVHSQDEADEIKLLEDQMEAASAKRAQVRKQTQECLALYSDFDFR